MRFGYFLFAFLADSVIAAPPSLQPASNSRQAKQFDVEPGIPNIQVHLDNILTLLKIGLNDDKIVHFLNIEIDKMIDSFGNFTCWLKRITSITEYEVSMIYRFAGNIAPHFSNVLDQVWEHNSELSKKAFYKRLVRRFAKLHTQAKAFIDQIESTIPSPEHSGSSKLFRDKIDSSMGNWTNLSQRYVHRRYRGPNCFLPPPMAPGRDPVPNAAHRSPVAAPAESAGENFIEDPHWGDDPVPNTAHRSPVAAPAKSAGEGFIEDPHWGDDPVPNTAHRSPVAAPAESTGGNVMGDPCWEDLAPITMLDLYPSEENLINPRCLLYWPSRPFQSDLDPNPDIRQGLGGSPKLKTVQNPTDHMQTEDGAGPPGTPMELEPVRWPADGSSTA